MSNRHHRVLPILSCLIGLIAPASSQAVVLYRSATRNTTAPTGQFANSGWQYQGQLGSFLGTPISSHYFVSAAHVGGDFFFTYNGVQYPIDSSFGTGGQMTKPGTDLRIFKINGTFPSWAPMYDANVDGSEAGKVMVVFGRGTQRGAPVYGRFPSPSRDGGAAMTLHELKGWQWGTYDAVQAWGTNYVEGTLDGGPDFGPLLYFNFDRTSNLNDECTLSAGDSSGGVFIQTASGWKLAGLNLAVDGPFKVAKDFPAIDAMLFDYGGMYANTGPSYQYFADDSVDLPASAYATEISPNISWIQGIIGAGVSDLPEPTSATLLLVAMPLVCRRVRR